MKTNNKTMSAGRPRITPKTANDRRCADRGGDRADAGEHAARDIAFQKITSRIEGTAKASIGRHIERLPEVPHDGLGDRLRRK